LIPSSVKGLTPAQVAERKEKGLVNTAQTGIGKSNFAIFRDNVLTLFNLYNLLIGIALALVNAWLNLFYLVIILTNITIGIVQEVRGRKLVNKLSILTADKVRAVRDGDKLQVTSDKLRMDRRQGAGGSDEATKNEKRKTKNDGCDSEQQTVGNALPNPSEACHLSRSPCHFPPPLPEETILGSLTRYLATPNPNFQPMNSNFGLLPPLDIRDKALRHKALSERSLGALARWIGELEKNNHS